MTLLDEERWYCYRDDELFLGKENGWQEKGTPLQFLTEEEQREVIGYFQALYIDGYRNLDTDSALVYVFDDHFRVVIGWPEPRAQFNIPYDSVRVFNVTHEREITAL